MRLQYKDIVRDGNGIIISNANISVYLGGTTTAANVYTSSTSTTAVNSVTSGSDGSFVFYVDAIEYGSDQTYKIVLTATINGIDLNSYTIDNITIEDAVLGNYTISTARTASYPIRIPNGVVYVKSGTGTLTFNAAFEAGHYQVFSGFTSSDVSFLSGKVKEVFPEWWGAIGDGSTDSAVAIDCAVASLTSGVVKINQGTYILGTLSSQANSHSSYIMPKDGVSIIGSGIDSTYLKVKSGENTLYYSENKPNIIATNKSGLLKNVRVSDLTFDWNGANNLLDAGATARNNMSFYAQNGGENIYIERVKVKETPGNQCIYIKNEAYGTTNGSNVVIRDCEFENNGGGLSGNYNTDHSSVYIQCDDSLIDNNYFNCDSATTSNTCYEIHGSRCTARNNKSNNYSLSFYVATDAANTEDVKIVGDFHNDVVLALSISSPSYTIRNLSIRDCVFTQRAGLTFGSLSYFVAGDNVLGIDTWEISDCRFTGTGEDNNTFLLLNKVNNFIFKNNVVEDFNGSASYGLKSSGNDIGTGNVVDNFSASGNVFNDVGLPVYFSNTLTAGSIRITDNEFNRTVADSNAVITLQFATAPVEINIRDNQYSSNYSVKRAGNFASSEKTYVPVITGSTGAGTGTYTTQIGKYYVTDDSLCTVFIKLVWTNHTGTGDLRVSLPITSRNTTSILMSGSVAASNLTYTAGGHLAPVVDANAAFCVLSVSDNGAAISNVAIDTAATIYITLTYEI